MKAFMSLICICTVLGTGLPVATVHAQTTATVQGAPPTWAITQVVKVQRVMTNEHGIVYVRTNAMINPAGCPSNYWYLLKGASETGDGRMLASVLTAKASDMDVRFGIANSECLFSGPKMVSVILE